MLRRAKYFAVFVLAIGILVLAGWIWNISYIIRPIPYLTAMNPLAAFGFMCAAASFLVLSAHPPAAKRRWMGTILAGLVLLIGVLRMAGFLPGYLPNRMANQTAFCFILCGLSLFTLDRTRVGAHAVSQCMTLLMVLVSLFSLIGYLYRVQAFYGPLTYIPMSVYSCVCFLLISVAILLAQAGKGIMKDKRAQLKLAAEKQLLESEERFRLLVGSVKDYAIFMVDTGGKIISWNEGAERIKGYKKEEIIGQNMSVFYTPDEVKRGEPHSIFWANIVFTALRDADGNLPGFTKVTRDITERKRTEEQIAYLARLMEDNSDAIFSTDSSFIIRTWNRAAELLYGYSIAEVKGQPAGKILRTPMNEDVISSIRKKMLRTGYWKGEVYYLTKGGNLLTILLSTTAVKNAMGHPDGFVMVCRDFTERKKLELQLQHFSGELEAQVKLKTAELTDYKYALDQSSIVSITDEKGVIKDVNDNFCRISGYRAAELIGESHRIVGSRYHPAQFFRQMWQTISKGEVWKGEIRNRAKDGTDYWVDMTIIAFLDAKGEPYEYIALGSDITERKKGEELLRQSYQEIRELASHLQDVREEERAGIAREIHDELGQQLTGLKMDLSWMSKRKIIESDAELKQKTIGTMTLLDTTIMTVRRIATDLRPSILDDLGLIAAIEWQSQEFERRSGICTEFKSTVDEFKHSSAIAIGLFRICQESLTNVARHAGADRIRISLQEENEYILLKIEDNGKGFEIQKIGDKKTLGLLGMKERTLMMGGEFRIESEPGKGTTLSVTVPVKIT